MGTFACNFGFKQPTHISKNGGTILFKISAAVFKIFNRKVDMLSVVGMRRHEGVGMMLGWYGYGYGEGLNLE